MNQQQSLASWSQSYGRCYDYQEDNSCQQPLSESYSNTSSFQEQYSSQQILDQKQCQALSNYSQTIYEPEYFLNFKEPEYPLTQQQYEINLFQQGEQSLYGQMNNFLINQLNEVTGNQYYDPLFSTQQGFNEDDSPQQSQSCNSPQQLQTNYTEISQSLNISSNQIDQYQNDKNSKFNTAFYYIQAEHNQLEFKESYQNQQYSKQQYNHELPYDYSQSIQSNTSSYDEEQKRKEKNVKSQNNLKNIMNAFIKFTKQLKTCDFLDLSNYEFQNVKKQLMRYVKQHSFNHSVVKYIVVHKHYKLLFLNFLSHKSEDWLNQSKVVEKTEAREQIDFLKNCIQDPSLLDSLIVYQSNNKKMYSFSGL